MNISYYILYYSCIITPTVNVINRLLHLNLNKDGNKTWLGSDLLKLTYNVLINPCLIWLLVGGVTKTEAALQSFVSEWHDNNGMVLIEYHQSALKYWVIV